MLLCYGDEAGNDQVLVRPDAAPVLALAGLSLAEANARELIWSFLKLKKEFNPQIANGRLSELITYEVKGSDLRADIRSGVRRRARRAERFIDQVLTLLEELNCTVTGCVRVKRDGEGVPANYYADSIATMAADFQAQLGAAGTRGLMILDARTKVKNTPSVHGITTRRFRAGGDLLAGLLESPVFGHSDCHAALQVVDIVVSALIFPMACHAYCADLVGNTHNDPAYAAVQERWGSRLRALEHRYTDQDGNRRGGIVVRDDRNHRQSHELFGAPAAPASPVAPTRQRLRNGVPSGERGTYFARD